MRIKYFIIIVMFLLMQAYIGHNIIILYDIKYVLARERCTISKKTRFKDARVKIVRGTLPNICRFFLGRIHTR